MEDYEAFLEKYSLILHPNHFHMVTAKHSLCQMLGRTEGCLIQDMPTEKVIFGCKGVPCTISYYPWISAAQEEGESVP